MATLISAENPGSWRRRCDATCHDAKHPKCVCICGGRYHGKGSGTPELQQAVKEFGDAVLGQEQHRQMRILYGDDSTTPTG